MSAGNSDDRAAPRDFVVGIGQHEINLILDLKEQLTLGERDSLEFPGEDGSPPGAEDLDWSDAAPSTELVDNLLEFLDGKVMADRAQYETMFSELARLTSQTANLEFRLLEWEKFFQEIAPGMAEMSLPGPSSVPYPPSNGVSASVCTCQESQEDLAAALEDFPDLPVNPQEFPMVEFCLRNYINLDPELGVLPLKEKLLKASQMAKGFLTVTEKDPP